MTRSRLQRWAPIWELALRANRLLKAERKAHRQTRQDLAAARAQQQNSADELIVANAEVRRLNALLDFIAVGRSRAMAESADGEGVSNINRGRSYS